MTKSLLRAELRTVQDVADLDVAEAAELFDELRTASVALGDRSRLRKVARMKEMRGRVHGHSAEGASGVTGADLRDVSGVLEVPDTFRDKAGAGCYSSPVPGRPEPERGRMEQQRRLQLGGGFSIEVAAIAFTGLIGMVGYAMQARSTQKASEAQARLDRDAAEREKAEVKAGKQLERVQLQMAEWVRPLTSEIHFLWFGWIAIAKELKLQGYIGLYCIEYVQQPRTPYIDILVNGANPAMHAAVGQSPYAQLPPEDLALLAADLGVRSRYCELAVTVLLPPLRRLNVVFATKFHLYESTPPALMDASMPGIGRDWGSLVGTLANVYWHQHAYAAQFESLVTRWEEERFDLLQPDMPGVYGILSRMSVEQIKSAGMKEVALLGVSSGSTVAAGSLDYVTKGVDSAGGKEVET
jgi:hypothetical protein